MKRIAHPASLALAVALSAGALLSVACNKTPATTDEPTGETHTTGAQMEAPMNPAPLNAPAPSDPNAHVEFPATHPGPGSLPGARSNATLPGALPGDTSGAPLGAVDEKARDDSYGGSANGGSSGPATGGGYASTGVDTVRPRANAPAKPGHILPPTKTTDLPH